MRNVHIYSDLKYALKGSRHIPLEQFLVKTANGYDYEHHRYYDTPETGAYRGYSLTITVSASSCGASASVTPKIINPNRFESNEDTKDWIGQAFVEAQRDAYTKVVRSYVPSRRRSDDRSSRRTTRRRASRLTSRSGYYSTQYVEMEEDSDRTDPHACDIQAQVKVVRAFVGTINIPDGGTKKITVEGGFELSSGPATGGLNITYEHEGESVTRVVVKVTKNEIVKKEDSYGRSATVETANPYHPPVDSEAKAEGIEFNGRSYDSRSEEYVNGFLIGLRE